MWAITRILIVIFCLFTPVFTAKAVIVAPSVTDLDLQPGASQVITLGVGNDEMEDVAYVAELQELDFSSGNLAFSPMSASLSSIISLSPESFTLATNATQELKVAVNVPVNFSPSSMPFAVLVTKQAADGGSVGLSTSVATLVFFSISGNELVQIPSIEAFLVQDAILARVGNDGQGILKPSVGVVVKNALGTEVSRIDLNPGLQRVPAGQTRIFTGPIASRNTFFSGLWREITDVRIGRFTAELSVVATSTSQQQAVTAKDHFWVWPWRLMLVVGIATALSVVTHRVRSRSN